MWGPAREERPCQPNACHTCYANETAGGHARTGAACSPALPEDGARRAGASRATQRARHAWRSRVKGQPPPFWRSILDSRCRLQQAGAVQPRAVPRSRLTRLVQLVYKGQLLPQDRHGGAATKGRRGRDACAWSCSGGLKGLQGTGIELAGRKKVGPLLSRASRQVHAQRRTMPACTASGLCHNPSNELNSSQAGGDKPSGCKARSGAAKGTTQAGLAGRCGAPPIGLDGAEAVGRLDLSVNDETAGGGATGKRLRQYRLCAGLLAVVLVLFDARCWRCGVQCGRCTAPSRGGTARTASTAQQGARRTGRQRPPRPPPPVAAATPRLSAASTGSA